MTRTETPTPRRRGGRFCRSSLGVDADDYAASLKAAGRQEKWFVFGAGIPAVPWWCAAHGQCHHASPGARAARPRLGDRGAGEPDAGVVGANLACGRGQAVGLAADRSHADWVILTGA